MFSNTAKASDILSSDILSSGILSSGILYSLIETAKANSIDPNKYLTHLLAEMAKRCAAGSLNIVELMP